MRSRKWVFRIAGQAACIVALLLLGGCRPADKGPKKASDRPLPLRIQVLPSKRVYRVGEKISIRIRLVNPTAKAVTVVVFEGQLNGSENWWPMDWLKPDNDEYILPDGTKRSALVSLPLPPSDDRAGFVTIAPKAAYQEIHVMEARVPGKWDYRVCFFVLRKNIYAGAYHLPPTVTKAGEHDKVEKFWKEWRAKGYIRADEPPYLVMKVNPDVTLGSARPVEARIEVRK